MPVQRGILILALILAAGCAAESRVESDEQEQRAAVQEGGEELQLDRVGEAAADERQRLVIRDSAGIEVVESSAPRWSVGEGWRVDPEGSLEIGTVMGEAAYEFSRIDQATRFPDGRIAIVEAREFEIRIFGPDGRHLVTMGGRGQGPGEFQNPPIITILAGDTLLAFDPFILRYTWFAPDGTVPRTAMLSWARLTDVFGPVRIQPTFIFPDGSFFVVSRSTSTDQVASLPGFPGGPMVVSTAPVNTLWTGSTRFAIVFPDAAGGIVLRDFPSLEAGVAGSPPRSVRVENRYLPPAHYGATRDPVRVHLTVAGRREIHTFNESGRLVRLLRQAIPLAPLTAGLITTERNLTRDSADARGVPISEAMGLFDKLVFPDSVFPYAELHADTEGNLWVMDHQPGQGGGDENSFQIFDSAGAWLGPVALPASVGRIMEIGGDYILGVQTDAFDVPFVRLSRLVKE